MSVAPENDGTHRYIVVGHDVPRFHRHRETGIQSHGLVDWLDTTIYSYLRSARNARTSFWKGNASIYEITLPVSGLRVLDEKNGKTYRMALSPQLVFVE